MEVGENYFQEQTVFRELIICLRKHQLAIQFVHCFFNYFNNVSSHAFKKETRILTYLEIALRNRIRKEFIPKFTNYIFIVRYARLLESSFMLSTGIQLSCNMLALSLTGIQASI